MTHRIILIPIGKSEILKPVCNNLKEAFANFYFLAPQVTEAEAMLAEGKMDEFLDLLVEEYRNLPENFNAVIIQGLTQGQDFPFAVNLNQAIARAFDAHVVFVADEDALSKENIATQIKIQTSFLGDLRIIGVLSSSDLIEGSQALSLNNLNWIQKLLGTKENYRLTPPFFRNELIKKSRQAQKRIVLPEGEEIRTIKAAIICVEREIAKPVLLGDIAKIKAAAVSNNLTLPDSIEIFEPTSSVVDKYAPAMVEIRKNKGLTLEEAREQLKDTVVLGTMMLKQGDVDGLVSGAVHSTADTVRPALQLIKTKPGIKIVSSVFFMCLPEQVIVCGDCAINPNPTAEELADIAIESAVSAKSFGIAPKVAMISYATGASGSGPDVELVKEATSIAREKSADLDVDGPLQFDAAVVKSVGKQKAPNSKVAGEATVLIFPDLNTGNSTYKAIQRSANVLAVGPMLQGLNKPVNDLSRGCLVEDIVFTIALTAIQAINS